MLSVNAYFIIFAGGSVRIADDFTTQRNPALADQVFCLASAAKTALRNHTGNAVSFGAKRGLRAVSFSVYLPRYALMFSRHFLFWASVPTVMRSTSPIAGCGRMMVPLACKNLKASIGSLNPLTAMKFAWLST